MKGIAARVGEAIVKLQQDDTENAMLQTITAIDGTARKRFGTRTGNRERFVRFLADEEDFLIYSAFSFGIHLYVKGRLDFAELGTLPELIYYSVRNPLVHEGDIGPGAIFLNREDELSFGFRDEKFMIQPFLVLGLLMLVIGAPENSTMTFNQRWMLTINEKDIDLNYFWGNLDLLQRQLGFEERPPELVA